MKITTNKGFTLIELLVVISIISLLSSVVLASVVDARIKARDTTRVEQLHQMDLAIGLYKADHEGKVPVLGAITGGNGSGCSASNQANKLNCVAKSSVNVPGSAWVAFKTEMSPYIKKLPETLNGIDYIYLPPASMGPDSTDEDYQVSADSEYYPDTDLGYSSEDNLVDVPTGPTFSLTSSNRNLADPNCYYVIDRSFPSSGRFAPLPVALTGNISCSFLYDLPFSWNGYALSVSMNSSPYSYVNAQTFNGVDSIVYTVN